VTDERTPDAPESDDAGADHAVPDDLLVLHQVIEWDEATK
jgi:hypothetical protein